jgi:hypothetical protein
MRFIVLSFTIFMTGCAATWESSNVVETMSKSQQKDILNDKPTANAAHIYLYRESAFAGFLAAWPVQFNNEKVGMLKNGTFLVIKTNPGTHYLYPEEHIISAFSVGIEKTTIDTKGGQSYFFRHGRDAFQSSALKFMPVAASTARKELSGYDLVSIIEKFNNGDKGAALACKYWTKTSGITDEVKAWRDIVKNVDKLRLEISKKKNPILGYDRSVKIKERSIPYDKVISVFNIADKVGKGDYKGAAQDAGGEMISFLVPFAGQYKALLDATKTSIDSVIANWTADLYLTKSYLKLSDIINHEITRSVTLNTPYYASELLNPRTPLYQKMLAREKKFFYKWRESQEFKDDFGFGIEAQANRSKIRQVLGKEAHPSEIYKHFYRKIVHDQKGYIEVSYNETIEYLMYEEMHEMKPKIINAVCSELHKVTRLKNE